MLSGLSEFKQLRHFAASALVLVLLAGCATTGETPLARKPGPAQPLDRLQVATLPPERDEMAQLLEGDFALADTDLKSAAAAYGRAAAVSDDPKVVERAVGLALAIHDSAAAETAIARWQAVGGKPAELAQARAQLALDRGQGAEAERQLEILVGTGDKDAWRNFGRVLVSARDAAQAGRLLETIATPERLPNDAQAWLAMSELGEQLGRHAYSQKIGDAAVARFKDAETYAWSGQMKFKAGDKAGAKDMFAKAMAKAPKNARLRLAYATLLGQSGDEVGALKILSTGAQDAGTFAVRTAIAARSNDQVELKRIYEQIQKAPDDVQDQCTYLLGTIAEMLDRKDEALDWYSQVSGDDEHAFDAAMRSAVVLQSQGKDEDAHRVVAELQTSYADQPEQLQKSFVLDAELYMREQQYANASGAYNKALLVKADDPGLLYARGLAYAEDGKIDLAVADFRRVLELKPGDIEASNALGYTLADSDRDLDEAQRLIGMARSARPADPAIADSWGWLQFRLGHLDNAEQVLRTAWIERKDADVGVHLAEVLWKKGQRDEAKQVLNEVRKIDPKSDSLRNAEQRLKP
ncbi:MAG TPA: tetratricopeptide repeat protein [Luteibacter sp.]|nr:tetratricopeptide repeat protein [Luteibacter sp.]